MKSQVVQVDLRDRSPDDALATVRRLLSGEDHTDLTLILVIDEATALKPHQQTYETLLGSRYTEHVLCVAVGRGEAEPSRIEWPGALTQAAGTLWVPDPAGINWRLAGAAAPTRRDRSEAPNAGLLRLLEILGMTDVFLEARQLIEKIPGRVANPGLALAGVSGERSDFLQALSAAGERILDPTTAKAPSLPNPNAGPPKPQTIRLRAGSPLATAADQARIAVTEARGHADELTEGAVVFVGPLPVEEATAAAGQSLQNLRDRMEELFSRAHSTVGLGAAEQDAIELAGVVLPELEDFNPARIRKTINGYLDDALENDAPLPKLVDGLDRQKNDLLPRGSRARIDALHVACPDRLLAGLRDPLPMPGPEQWLPAVGLVAGALAGLTPFGLVSGLLMAVVWTLMVALVMVRGPGGRPPGRLRSLGVNGLAAVVGGVGIGLVVAVRPPPVVWSLAIAAALGLTAAATFVSGRTRARLWAAESGLDATETTVDDLLVVLSAAAREWSQAGARVATADAVARMSFALGQVTTGVRDRVVRLRGEVSGIVRPDPRIQHYLGDLVRAAMAPRLRELAAGSTAEHGEDARRTTAELFDIWTEHTREHGPLSCPPFAIERAIETSELPPAEMSEQVAAHDPYDVMWQLCGADDLQLLDLGSAPPAVVRFAPQHTRMVAEELLPADTVWVPSAQHAGVLRMVPIQAALTIPSW